MPNLSYSFHLSTKSHSVSTTGKVEQVSRHNLRQYKSDHYDQGMIDILRGSETSILEDVKRIYHEEFDEALEKYNKGKRADRVITDYLEHISNSRSDVACEIIIQIGDRDFWDNAREKGWKNTEIAQVMSSLFKSQLQRLEELVPELKIASAVVHYDESSPHMHIVGVPVASGYKKGLAKQAAKTKVFTPERLSHLQDQMRECANLWIGLATDNETTPFGNADPASEHWNIDPKEKQKGRNKDIPKWSLDEYYRTKRETESLKSDLQEQHKQVQRLNSEKYQLERSIERKKHDEKWVDLSIAAKREKNSYLELNKSLVEKEITTLETQKNLVEADVRDLQKNRAELSQELSRAQEGVKELVTEKNALKAEITNLQADKAFISSDVRGLQEQKKNLEKDVEGLDQEKNAAQKVIGEAVSKRSDLRQLRLQIEREEEEIEALSKKEAEARKRLAELSEQADEKLSIVDTELSPEFVHQMLNDSVTSNLVQETILQTCRQLGSLGYLNVDSTKAYLKINRNTILESVKEHVTDFIGAVKAHIRKALLKRNKTYHRGR